MANRIPGTQADPTDIEVGKRIKLRRQMIHVSQDVLARETGVTFQQIQKYESGHNRVSASRLYQVAKVLKVPVSYFFDGLPSTLDGTHDPMKSTAAVELVRRFFRLDKDGRKALLELLKSMQQGRVSDEVAA